MSLQDQLSALHDSRSETCIVSQLLLSREMTLFSVNLSLMRQMQLGSFRSSSNLFRRVISKYWSPHCSTSGLSRSISASRADLSWCSFTCWSMRDITLAGANLGCIVCTERAMPLRILLGSSCCSRWEMVDWQFCCDLKSYSEMAGLGGCLSRRRRSSRGASLSVIVLLGCALEMEVWTWRGWYSRLVLRCLREASFLYWASWSILRKSSSPPTGRCTSLFSSVSLKMLEGGSRVAQAGS